MFGKLKDRLKSAISVFSKEVEEDVKEDVAEEPKEESTPEPVKEEPIPEPVREEPIPEPVKEEPVPEPEERVEEAKEEKVEDLVQEESEEPEEKQGFFKRFFSKKKEVKEEVKEEVKDDVSEEVKAEVKEEVKEETKEEPQPEVQKEEVKESIPKPVEKEAPEVVSEPIKEPKEEKKSFFKKIVAPITTTTLSEPKFEELFWNLEVAMLENNVATAVIEKIKLDLKNDLTTKPIPRGKVGDTVIHSLKHSLDGILSFEPIDLVSKIHHKKPFVVCFIGVNGSGKTTSIAKVAKMLQKKGLKVVLAAGDTFRAAAIDQLQKHADALDIRLVKHDYGSDPAAVAYDAIEHARAKNMDAVLIDTAGRLHSNDNLLEEMKKIIRVAKPDMTVFVGESITGNDCVEQATKFSEAVNIDGIILSKADVDDKGGAAVSVSYVTKKPILFLGTGQQYEDLEVFDKEKVLGSLGL